MAQDPVAQPKGATAVMRDPVCAAIVPADAVGAAVTRPDGVYSFCSEECLAIFETNPDKFVGPGHRRVVDPVCGQSLWFGQTIFHFEHKGTDHRFCGEACYDRFTLDPDYFHDAPEFA